MPQVRIRRYLKHGTFAATQRIRSSRKTRQLHPRRRRALHGAAHGFSADQEAYRNDRSALFEQVGNHVHVTETGRELQTACREIFQALVNVEDRFASIRGLESGRLQLAVSTTGKYFAPRMLAAFVQQHPGIDVSLQIHNRQTLLERLANNVDDLYLFADPPGDVEVVVQQILPNRWWYSHAPTMRSPNRNAFHLSAWHRNRS